MDNRRKIVDSKMICEAVSAVFLAIIDFLHQWPLKCQDNQEIILKIREIQEKMANGFATVQEVLNVRSLLKRIDDEILVHGQDVASQMFKLTASALRASREYIDNTV